MSASISSKTHTCRKIRKENGPTNKRRRGGGGGGRMKRNKEKINAHVNLPVTQVTRQGQGS